MLQLLQIYCSNEISSWPARTQRQEICVDNGEQDELPNGPLHQLRQM